jgi:hypothetical protein
MAKELLDIANLIFFITIPISLEAWLCAQHLRSYLASIVSLVSLVLYPPRMRAVLQ